MTENPILKKLQMKNGQRAIILGAPDSYRPVLEALPSGVEVTPTLDGTFDFVHLFVADKVQMERRIPELKAALRPAGILWIS